MSPRPSESFLAAGFPAPVPPTPAREELERSLRRPRTLFSAILDAIVAMLTLSALVPLFSVLYMLVTRGGHRLSLSLFTKLPPTAFEEGGGFGNALVGTIVMVGIGALISVPMGMLAAVFVAEVGPRTRLARVVLFSAKVLIGLPSILAGVFAYAAVVMLTGKFSAVAGGIALSLLMLPIVLLTAEDAIRMVPGRVKEAAYGMGANPTQVIWHVTLPTALPGMLTGVMLAVARAAGETAPLLFTALFSNYWLVSHGKFRPMQPTASLAVLIYNFSSMPFENQIEMAWAAALVLVFLVLVINLAGRALSARGS